MSLCFRIQALFFILLLSAGMYSYGQSPEITAVGDQAYCPLSEMPVVTDFNINNPGGIEIEKIHIQISEGYQNAFDRLKLLPGHPDITVSSFNIQQGKLTLTAKNSGVQALTDLIAAVKDVVFWSTSSSISGEKFFSFTLDDANYLDKTGHFYEYVPALGITWTDAKVEAENRYNQYGWQGYLATILYTEEAALVGEQAEGAGWIGGSDQVKEGEWKWVTGPSEDHIIFWNGLFNGSAPFGAYANWNNAEPNQSGDEDYCHIVNPGTPGAIPGSWNDLSNTGSTGGDYQPKGYIVEYGGMDPANETPISTISTKISVPEVTPIDGVHCGPGSVSLSADTTGDTVFWFTAPTGGAPIGNGSPFSTPPISDTTTFYVLGSSNGCVEGTRTAILAEILPIPTVSASDVIVCGAGKATFNATASEGVVLWYTAATGGNFLGSGNVYETQIISTTTTYYMAASANSCETIPRVPVTATVVYTPAPTATSPQEFCENSAPTVTNLTSIGDNIKWYSSVAGGTALPNSAALQSGTYYVTQTNSGCESLTRTAVDVVVYESPKPKNASELAAITVCDDELDGSGINGFSTFDITQNETAILNSQSASDFSIAYYWESDFSVASKIATPNSIENTKAFTQTIYVRVTNKLDSGCFNDTSFEIEVFEMPQILATIELKNCDLDGVTDGFTDYNLDEANALISSNSDNEVFSHYLSLPDAQAGTNPIVASPYNNSTSNTVFVRVETSNGCFKIATIDLNVSATAFDDNYNFEIQTCDADDVNDGLASFDLSVASDEILSLLPPGQPLQVYYYTSLESALLETGEIQTPNNYINQTAHSEDLFVRIENEENGDCYDIGPYVTLTVHSRPEFVVVPEALTCLNLSPTPLDVLDADGNYTYEWTDENGAVISSTSYVEVHAAGDYSIVATSAEGCESFPQTVTVSASINASISNSDITVVENSMNNSIEIDPNNLGIGDYEFSLNDMDGPYADLTYFDQLKPGIHTIYVRDKKGCGISAHDVYILGFQKYFSPNGDGVNDFWQVKGVDPATMQASPAHIFDRYGKILKIMDVFGEGWDGSFNGEILPATEYWYNVTITDATGKSRNLTGHFSLLR